MATAQNQPIIETPSAPTPQPRRKGKFWRGLGFATLVIAGSGLAYGTLTPQGRVMTQDVVQAKNTLIAVQQNPDLLFKNVGDDRVNLLLIGEDRSWEETKVFNPKLGRMVRTHLVNEDETRSDTMIVVSLDRATKKMYMVSFPRDARVRYIDPRGRKQKDKMNAVYASGGKDPIRREEVLKDFFRDEMGLRIDRLARIRIEGFTGLIDQVGGLDIDVDGALKLVDGKVKRGQHIFYEDKYGGWKVDLDPGKQHLDGEQAVGYARFRYDREGDPGRIRRQQQVMKALAKKITGLPIYQMPGAVKEIKQQFATDMSDEEMASMALFAKSIGADAKISPLTVFGVGAKNRSDIILNKPENIKMFSYIFGSSFDANSFLNRSESTDEDELGLTNNRNPAALEVLRGAGILPPESAAEPNTDSPNSER